MAQMTPQIHNWLFEKAGELEFPGKMGGAFATEQYTHGGGTQVIQSILTIEMVRECCAIQAVWLVESQ